MISDQQSLSTSHSRSPSPPRHRNNLPPVGGEGEVDIDVPPPPYHEDIKVIPMTAEQTTRYDRGPLPIKSLPKHLNIPMALYTLTAPPGIAPVPAGWIEFVHPEGQKYYYHQNRRIITDSNIKQPAVLQALYRALSILDLRLNAQNLILPQTTEVTFEVDIDQHPPVVRYYYVDHAQKTQFWLEKTTTETLKCPPVTSFTHLKYLFRQHYWTHIEFYPMHLTLSVDVEDELVAVLTHACIDYMTSTLSTVPYNQEQCEAYLRLIRKMPESDRAEGYRNCVLARLWSEIDGNFFVNLRGEDTPRLSRIQRLLPEPSLHATKLLNFFKGWLMLGSSETYERTLSEMWVDKISYASHWRKFMNAMVNEWKMHAIWTFVLLIVTSSTFALSITSQAINGGWIGVFLQSSNLIALMISLIGLGASFLLVKTHRSQTEASASEAGDYLDKYFHKSLGLQPLSIMYALPQASSVWSFAFLTTSMLTFTMSLDSKVARTLVILFVVFAVIALWFLSVCLSGRDDGSGSSIKNGVRRITERAPEVLRRIPERIRSLSGRIREIRIILPRVEFGDSRRIDGNGTQNLDSSTTGDTVANDDHAETRDNEVPTQRTSTGSGRSSPMMEPSSSTSSRSNISGSGRTHQEYASRSNISGRGRTHREYVPRQTTIMQNLTSSASTLSSAMMNHFRIVMNNLTNGHRYQLIESSEPTETPLEAQFRIRNDLEGRSSRSYINRRDPQSPIGPSMNAYSRTN